MRTNLLNGISLAVTCYLLTTVNALSVDRVERGLLVRYDLNEGDGRTIHDQA